MRRTPAVLSPIPPLFKAVVEPVRAFFQLEATSGIILVASAAIAVFWANSPARDLYAAVWGQTLQMGIGSWRAQFTVAQLINDGLMSIFFFVVGMEIKRELVLGELNTLSKAALPGIAAVGGMVFPAALYVAFNAGSPGLRGWAIPMATDIAFAIGCLTLLKGRVPNALIVFLTALAIFDDMGGILVIALFYGHGLHPVWLLAAAVPLGMVALLGRLNVKSGAAYALAGGLLWLTVHEAGIHATIAGVILGLMIPARERRPALEVIGELARYTDEVVARGCTENVANEEILRIEERLEELEPPLNRFVHGLHPWVAYGIMPVFALANSGIDLSGFRVERLTDPVLLGAALGLAVGKPVGIFALTFLAVKLGWAVMPGDAPKTQLWGVAMVAGIGFTVALFIGGLAFGSAPLLLEEAKVGIFAGSIFSGVLGYAVLRFTGPRRHPVEQL